MIQRAGIAGFYLPNDWNDRSYYAYSDDEDRAFLTMFIEDHYGQQTIDQILKEKMESVMEISANAKIVQPVEPLSVGGEEARTVTFDLEGDETKRMRILLIKCKNHKILTVLAKSALEDWMLVEQLWTRFIGSFSINWEN